MPSCEPAALLAIETPNPECLAIFATHFYLDPTHRHPIPPALASFYLEEAGFGRIEIERLSPAIESMPSLAELPEAFRKEFFGGLDYVGLCESSSADRSIGCTAACCRVCDLRPSRNRAQPLRRAACSNDSRSALFSNNSAIARAISSGVSSDDDVAAGIEIETIDAGGRADDRLAHRHRFQDFDIGPGGCNQRRYDDCGALVGRADVGHEVLHLDSWLREVQLHAVTVAVEIVAVARPAMTCSTWAAAAGVAARLRAGRSPAPAHSEGARKSR